MGTAKVNPRGVECMMVGYSMDHADGVYKMWNPITNRIIVSRDIIWMRRMYYKPVANSLNAQFWFRFWFHSGSSSIQVLFKFRVSSVLVLFWFRSGSVLVLFRFCSSSVPVLFQFCSSSVPVLFRFSSYSFPVLFRFCCSPRCFDLKVST